MSHLPSWSLSPANQAPKAEPIGASRRGQGQKQGAFYNSPFQGAHGEFLEQLLHCLARNAQQWYFCEGAPAMLTVFGAQREEARGQAAMMIDRNTTALVVDSTADLPENLAQDPNLTLVPLTVFFGEESYLDWVELRPEQFYEKLAAAPSLPKTSQPPPAVWMEVFSRLREQYQRVYSVHLSAEFSGTYETARMVAEEFDGVTVVDSRLATGGIALLVDRMMERLDRGVSQEEFDGYIRYFDAHKTFVFLPTTLDYLHKGGRIGRASHLVGTLLNIKPVLEIKDGVADVYKKARGVNQAIILLRDCLLARTEPGADIYANLSHGLNVPVMERLRDLLLEVDDRRIHLRPPSVVGSVIGTYIGPGAVGLGFIQE